VPERAGFATQLGGVPAVEDDGDVVRDHPLDALVRGRAALDERRHDSVTRA
jgi:hypothetical protein